jgi:mRNA interferase YafQ
MKPSNLSTRFEKDIHLMKRRGKNISKLQDIMLQILNGETLATKHRPHKLIGNYLGMMECHIEPDWLLIWEETPDAIYFMRTGSHSDLF